MGMKRSLASISLALTLGAVACTSDDPGATLPTENLTGEDIILTSGLQTVGDCDALLERLIAEGIERVGPYGFGHGGWGPEIMFGSDDAMEESEAALDSGGPVTLTQGEDASGGGNDAVSGTNNQEVGVDEADIVKTDGDRMIVVARGQVQILDISSGTPVLRHSVKIDEYGGSGELFINGDEALLMSRLWTQTDFRFDGDWGLSSRPAGTQMTRITPINLDNGTTGTSIEFEGGYLSAREIDGSIRIVISTGMGNFGWLFPSNADTEDIATEANKELLRKSTIGNWLPSYRILDGDEVVDGGLLFDCDRTHIPAEFSGFGSIGILTVDGNNDFALTDSLGVVTDGQTVYASTDRMTIATPRYPEWDPQTGQMKDGEKLWTALHNFDITDRSEARYVASGRVDGSLLSQYSLSEHNGNLRVATTVQVGDDWNDTSNSVVVLAEEGSALVQTGRVDDLGNGEQIFAVRFQGDTAYVVTFRQTDPLYVIDLSDPNAPVTRGELKIPGFSNYLHPVGDGLLLGIGQDATDEGRQTGAQASLFDVSDPTNPLRIDTFALGGENSNSIVQWDARAFTYWAETNTAIVPVESWEWDEVTESNSASAVLIDVVDRKLVEAGKVSHKAVTQCETNEGIVIYDDEAFDDDGDAEASFASQPAPDREEYCWSFAPSVVRTVIANGTLYTVSDAGVHSWDLDTLAPGEWVSFS